MGKKNKKAKDKKAEKAEGGVKLPKALRKFGDEAVKLAKQPVVSEIAAAALLAAAAALRDNKNFKATAKAAGDAGEAAARDAGEAAQQAGRDAAKIGDALRTLALDLARTTLDRVEERVEKKSAKAPAAKPKKTKAKAPAEA